MKQRVGSIVVADCLRTIDKATDSGSEKCPHDTRKSSKADTSNNGAGCTPVNYFGKTTRSRLQIDTPAKQHTAEYIRWRFG